MVRLVVLLNGIEVLNRVLEPGEYTLGRGADCDVLLEDPGLLELHALLQAGPGSLKVKGRSDEWNMSLGGEAVNQADLAPGQGLFIGPFELRWQEEGGAAATEGASEPEPEPEPDAGDRTVVFAPREDFHDQATVIAPSPDAPQAVFLVRRGELPQARYTARAGKNVAGRSDGCDLFLPAGTVSRRHAEIQVGPDGVSVRDLGSTSGVFVNEKQVGEAPLKPGDSLRLGEVLLELAEAPGRAPAAPAAKTEPPAEPPPKAAKKKKPQKPKKPKKVKPAGLKASQKSRRPLLYGVAGAVALALILVMVIAGGRKDKGKPAPAEEPAGQTQQAVETDQLKRMVVINLAKGKAAMSEGNYALAEDFFRQVLAVEPNHAEAEDLKAQVEKAIADAQAARLKQEQEEAARVDAARETLAQTEEAWGAGDYERTIQLGEKVLEVNPNEAMARHLVIKAQAALEAVVRAKQEEEESRQKRAALAGEYLAQAQAKLKKKDLLGARENLRQVLEADPEGRSPEGVRARKLLASVNPKIKARADGLYAKGARLLRRGRLEKAVGSLRRALKIDPEHKKAAKALAKARKKAIKLAQKLYQEGKVLQSLGKNKPACGRWRRGVAVVEPEDDVYARLKAQLERCEK